MSTVNIGSSATSGSSTGASSSGSSSGGISGGGYLAMGLTSAIGSISTSLAQSSMLKLTTNYEKDKLLRAAKFAEFFGESRIKAGEVQARAVSNQSKQRIGSIRASAGAQGIEINTGGVADMQAKEAELGAVNSMNVRSNAWREAWGYRAEAAGLTSSAKFAAASGEAQRNSTAITGGAQAVDALMKGYSAYKNN